MEHAYIITWLARADLDLINITLGGGGASKLHLCETVSPNTSVEVNTDTLAGMITEFGCISDISPSNSTAVIPRSMLAVGAEMKVKPGGL